MKARRKPPQWRIIKCERCGVKVSTMGRQTKYCPDCAKAVRKEKNRVTMAASNERRRIQREEAKRKATKPHKPQIDETARRARELGMSYGKYVAMMEMKKGA